MKNTSVKGVESWKDHYIELGLYRNNQGSSGRKHKDGNLSGGKKHFPKATKRYKLVKYRKSSDRS